MSRGAWVVQLVKRPTLAQVMISRVPGFEPHVGLSAHSSEPGAYFRFCVSLSLCPIPTHALSLSVLKISKTLKKNFKKEKVSSEMSHSQPCSNPLTSYFRPPKSPLSIVSYKK